MAVPLASLKACRLFAGFTDTGLAIIADIAKTREVSQGLSIFLAGTSGDGLLVVESGEVEITSGQGEAAKALCMLAPGDHFGELALLRSGKRAVTARAKSAVRLVEIARADFNQALKEKPQACLKLMLAIFGAVGERLHAVREDLLKLV